MSRIHRADVPRGLRRRQTGRTVRDTARARSGLGYLRPDTARTIGLGPEGWWAVRPQVESAPPARSRVWVPCAIAVVAVTAGGIVLLGFRVANEGPEPAGQNWWLVTWFCVGLTYSVVGAALVARSSRRRLGVCFLIVGASAVASALATEYRSLGSGRSSAVPGVRRGLMLAARS